MAGGFLYANKSIRYDSNSQRVPPTNIIRINIETGEDKVVIPNSYLFVSSSFDNKLCLVSIKGDYPYNDVWILNTEKKTLTCYMKIPINDTNTKPEISVMSLLRVSKSREHTTKTRFFVTHFVPL